MQLVIRISNEIIIFLIMCCYTNKYNEYITLIQAPIYKAFTYFFRLGCADEQRDKETVGQSNILCPAAACCISGSSSLSGSTKNTLGIATRSACRFCCCLLCSLIKRWKLWKLIEIPSMPLALLAKPTNYHHYASAVTLANRPGPPSLPRIALPLPALPCCHSLAAQMRHFELPNFRRCGFATVCACVCVFEGGRSLCAANCIICAFN